MIDVEGVRVAFGDTAVLSGVDLRVRRGELVGLVGPNGAGKTTLLRTVNGLLAPDAGTVRVDGDTVGELHSKEVSRRVATVPQETHLSFAFTVTQVVEMGRTPHRSRLDWQDAAEAVDRALERTETAHLADRTVEEVSGGERQRVLLARALAQEAPALVLDEPTASLDVNHQVRVLELVRGLVDDGRTAVAAIHDLDLAARYCDRLALLHDGEVVALGRPVEVLRPEHVEQAFDTDAAVGENAVTGTPAVTAVGRRPDRNVRVHVVGGGRPAARAIGACWRAGFDVSVGIVPDGDVAATVAGDLDVPVVTAPPFDGIGEATRTTAADMIGPADVVAVATDDPEPVTAGLVADHDATVTVAPGDDAADLADAFESDADSAPDAPLDGQGGSSVVAAVYDELGRAVAGDD